LKNLDVYIITGKIGSGKTTLARELERHAGIHLLDRDLIREELGITHYDPRDSERIDHLIEARLEENLLRGEPVSVGAASFVKRERRVDFLSTLAELESHIGRRIQAVFIECVCPIEEAKRRIALRSPNGAATNNPDDYDKLSVHAQPICAEELVRFPQVSFLSFDTHSCTTQPIQIRSAHQEAVRQIESALSDFVRKI